MIDSWQITNKCQGRNLTHFFITDSWKITKKGQGRKFDSFQVQFTQFKWITHFLAKKILAFIFSARIDFGKLGKSKMIQKDKAKILIHHS